MNDLDIIKQLEQEIGKKLEHFTKIEKVEETGYVLNENNEVIQLNLSKCDLNILPNSLFNLKKIENLYLIGTKIENLPESFSQLKNLSVLSLSSTELKELPESFGQLQNLSSLDLSKTELKELPESFWGLGKLQKLCLNNNKIKQLSKKILDLNLELYWEDCYDFFVTQKKESGITLKGNPLKSPFPEIIQQGQQTIREYFDALEQGEPAPTNEAKVLILGQGGVGKTSLVNRLVDDSYNDDENKTEGINVKQWPVCIDNENIRLNVWDFGGQEIMHATHQFFLTQRSLYLLLLDARQGEKVGRLEYWLKIIQTYGGNSPILLAINKTDQYQIKLNEKFLFEKYPNIKGFYNISCKTDSMHSEQRLKPKSTSCHTFTTFCPKPGLTSNNNWKTCAATSLASMTISKHVKNIILPNPIYNTY